MLFLRALLPFFRQGLLQAWNLPAIPRDPLVSASSMLDLKVCVIKLAFLLFVFLKCGFQASDPGPYV